MDIADPVNALYVLHAFVEDGAAHVIPQPPNHIAGALQPQNGTVIVKRTACGCRLYDWCFHTWFLSQQIEI
jgi:hypothetical protein